MSMSVLVKTTYQLSIDVELKSRLDKLKAKTGLAIAKIIDTILHENLSDYERGARPLTKTNEQTPKRGG